MMLPALANVPGHTLMPNRRPALSRPLLVDPPAFFVACRMEMSDGDDAGCDCWCGGGCCSHWKGRGDIIGEGMLAHLLHLMEDAAADINALEKCPIIVKYCGNG